MWFCPIVACKQTDLGWQAAIVNARLVLNAAPRDYAVGKPNPSRFKESHRP